MIAHRFEHGSIQEVVEGKWDMTYAGLKMFVTSPVIGLGYQGYYDNYSKYNPYAWKEHYDAHNIFITALTNYGVIGFMPFMAIFLYPLYICKQTLQRKNRVIPSEHTKDMAIICIVSVTSFMFNGFYSGGLFYSPIQVALLYTNISLLFGAKTLT